MYVLSINRAQGRDTDRRSGIALVVVLGLLSVMVVMAVAFSISMRMERLAASSYVDMVSTRHLMDAALARIATEEIRVALDGRRYPDWRAISSDGDGAGLRNAVTELYIPDALAGELATDGGWQPLTDAESGETLGEFAYVVFDNSGFLDANLVGSESLARAQGGDPGEIRLNGTVLAEVRNQTLQQLRNEIGFFVSVPELYQLGMSATIVDPPPFQPLPRYVDHFTVYSYFPCGYGVEGAQGVEVFDLVDISGDPDAWDRDAIRDALRRQPTPLFNDAMAEAFMDLMHDYASDGYVPLNPEGMSIKRVPLINEVTVIKTLERVAGVPDDELILRVNLYVETAYLFPADGAAPDFTVRIPDASLAVVPADYAALANLQHLANEVPDLTGVPGAPTVPGPAELVVPGDPLEHSEFDYQVTGFVFESRMTVPLGAPALLQAQLLLGNLEVEADGQVVDVVRNQWPAQSFLSGWNTTTLVPGRNMPIAQLNRFYSVNDPRLNWNPATTANQWQTTPHTLGARNSAVMAAPHGRDDEFDFMFSAQRPFVTVAELSYLLYDAELPWSTVRLLGPDPDESARLMDRFTVDPDDVGRGVVNINTPYAPVLASVFLDAPATAAPPDAVAPDVRIDVARAQTLAARVQEAIDSENPDVDPLLNRSDLAQVLSADAVADGGSKFETESFVRNSWELLGTRQNLFTVWLAVRTLAEDGVTVTGEQRAVALVWRDAYTRQAEVSYRTFIPFFSWLTRDQL